jgi:hypothetical protein
MPHGFLLRRSKNPSGKRKGKTTDGELKQTEMFIGDLSGNDCVDLLFEKYIGRVQCDFSSSGSRTFACVFVDVYSHDRHS